MQEIVYKRDFNAGNFWGKWYDDEGQGEYQVYSYRQCIGTYYLADEKWILDTKKYSMTTSKHQNYLKRAVNTPDLALVWTQSVHNVEMRATYWSPLLSTRYVASAHALDTSKQ